MFQRRSALIGTIITALMMAGCSQEESAADRLARIRARVDATRQCGLLITGRWPIAEYSARTLSGPQIDALVAAGLIRLVPARDPERVRVAVTPFGRAHTVIERVDSARSPDPFVRTPLTEHEKDGGFIMLCYGEQQLVSVRQLQDKDIDNNGKRQNSIVYDYRTINPPAWTARADIRAAFPRMVEDLGKLHSAYDFQYEFEGPPTGVNFSP